MCGQILCDDKQNNNCVQERNYENKRKLTSNMAAQNHSKDNVRIKIGLSILLLFIIISGVATGEWLGPDPPFCSDPQFCSDPY